jgi:hypothetical protein
MAMTIDEHKPRACEKHGAFRIDVWEKPMGPFPGFPLRIPRCVVNIRVPVGPLDNAELLAMAQEQKTRVLSFGKHYCAMAFHFWTTEQLDKKQEGGSRFGKEEATAIIDWAPGGKWEDALDAKIGDYTKHSFRVMENHTQEDEES